MCVRLRRGSRQGVDVQCETSNPARGRVRFHHTFTSALGKAVTKGVTSHPARGRVRFHPPCCHSLAEGRRGLAQGYLRILELFLSYGRLDFLDETLECTESRMITVVPLHGLGGAANP